MASAYTLNLGTVTVGAAALTANLGVLNAAVGPADLLDGSFSVSGGGAPLVNGGFTSFANDAAGATAGGDTITLNTGTAGVFGETITLAATGTNASGYAGALAAETLTVTGTVVAPVNQTFTLTTGPDTFTGGAGNNTVDAATNTLSSGDNIDGGVGGTNTLALTGGGLFNLKAPTTLTNIQTITAQEGQALFVSGSEVIPAQNQIVYLRDGLDATVNATAATLNPSNPRAATLTIIGAHNAAVINLAAGNDTVLVGDTRETVHGGTGNDTIMVSAATINATIDGGTGKSTLYVTGGGTVTMGSSITNITTVLLASAPGNISFIANTEAGLTVVDQSKGADVISPAGPARRCRAATAPIRSTQRPGAAPRSRTWPRCSTAIRSAGSATARATRSPSPISTTARAGSASASRRTGRTPPAR